MYLNGIQGMLDQQHAADIYIDKATVIAGPNLGIVGTPNRENLGGTILFTSKKAQAEPNLDLTLAYQGGKSFKEAVDFGTRLGHNQRWGVRVMADNIQGETAIDGDKLTQRDFFVNIDQKTKRARQICLSDIIMQIRKGRSLPGISMNIISLREAACPRRLITDAATCRSGRIMNMITGSPH